MRKIPLIALAAALAAVALPASAGDPSGRWKTLDDETGRPMSVVEVSTTGGTLSARVVETLNEPNAKCTECSGADKNKPVIGMRVLWDLTLKNGVWSNGSGFKPSTGDSFKARSVVPSADGRTLEITGCKLMFCRTARWVRAD